jgi:hypothetical protein
VYGPPETDRPGTGLTSPDWYPDPTGRFELRYFNGSTWTADVAEGGRRLVDPRHDTDPGRPGSAGRRGKDRLAGLSMLAGIVAVAVGWMPYVVAVGAVAAVAAIALAVVARRRAARTGLHDPRAGVGLLMGCIGLLTCVAGVLLTIVFVDALDRFGDPAPHRAEISDCRTVDGLTTAEVALTATGEPGGTGDAADFTVEVHFVRSGTDNVLATSRLELDDVAIGTSSTATTTRRTSESGAGTGASIDCIVAAVHGPYPFGVDFGW